MAQLTSRRDPVRLAKQCTRCHGWLVSPASLKVRMGPTCRQHAAAERRAAQSRQLALFERPEPESAQSPDVAVLYP